VQHNGPVYARSIKKRRGPLGDTWFMDEDYIVTVRGERRYRWRAVDQESLKHASGGKFSVGKSIGFSG